MNRIKQRWFPLAILVIFLMTVGWILAMVSNSHYIQKNKVVVIPSDRASRNITGTEVPTSTSTSSLSPTPVAISTPTPTPNINCTYTKEYWRTNTDSWKIENIILGNRSYNVVEAVAILDSEAPSLIESLTAAFFTTLLNTLNGADSSEIDQDLVEARYWLILRPYGIDLGETEIIEIYNLTVKLEDYNNGLTGPGLCIDGTKLFKPEEPSQTPTISEPEIMTLTPTEGIKSEPATSTPAPLATLPRPTATATKSGGGKPKPTKTQPPPPPPTNTNPPPLPTNTQPPPPTSTPKPTQPPPTPAPTQPPDNNSP